MLKINYLTVKFFNTLMLFFPDETYDLTNLL